MISFDILTADTFGKVTQRMREALGEPEITDGMLESFLEIAEEGAEVAVCSEGGELLVRIFDEGRYSFVYPIEVGEATDTDAALIALAEYSVREMIPFYLTDTPREELDRLRRLFSHVDARAYSDDEDSFVALVYSECDMLGSVPEVSLGGVTLSEITASDTENYARLSRSAEVNKYWGYDFAADRAEADDGYFLRVAESEFHKGIALSLAIREGGADAPLLGEAVLFNFDYRGGAMVALRLLPEHWGRGLGSRALAALIELGRNIGLCKLYSEVMLENVASVGMTEKHMRRTDDNHGKARFELSLAEGR